MASYIKDVLGLTEAAGTGKFPVSAAEAATMLALFGGLDGVAIGTALVPVGTTGKFEITATDLTVIVAAYLKKDAADRYAVLVTILKLGMQKIVVTEGVIESKLTFHVDASQTMETSRQITDRKASGWQAGLNLSATIPIKKIPVNAALGGSGGQSRLTVTVANERMSAAVNMKADIMGSVRLVFRTESFPALGA